MSSSIKFCAALALVAGLTGTAVAKPYASMIRVNPEITINPLELEVGTGAEIFYFLNEPADTVDIEIQNTVTNAIVATFTGTTDRGENTVTWNGTADNASGTNVPVGNYRVLITANKNNTQWAEIASQRTTGQYGPGPTLYSDVYDGFSPNHMLFVQDVTSDHFGRSYANSSYVQGSNPSIAAVEFRSDLSIADGTNGYDSRVFRMTPYDGNTYSTNPRNYDSYMWVGSVDPDIDNIIYYAGQVTPRFWYADIENPDELQNGDPNNILTGLLPRSVVVVKEGEDKYAYFTAAYTIRKAKMDGNTLVGPLHTVADFGSTRYARNVQVDSEGNLYFLSRGTGTAATVGSLLRWDREDTLGATPSLTAANASWVVTAASDMSFLTGPAISPTDGNVYVAAGANPAAPGNGIYLVGNTSDATIDRTLSLADRIVDTYSLSWNPSTAFHQVVTDPVGNIVYIERQQEQLRMYTPGGTSEITIPAPDSQTFTVVTPSNVENWSLY